MNNLEVGADFKSGFITVIGQPNVGKSTLINQLIGQKIAITSRKAQTTRNKIQCILTLDQAQMIFLDTPGVHQSQDKMGQYLNEVATQALKDINLVLFMVDANYPPNYDDKRIAQQLTGIDTPVLLVLNKVDTIDKKKLASRINDYEKLGNFIETVTISALEEVNLDHLVDQIVEFMPQGPKYYPDDMVTDQIEQFIIAELIREQVLNYTHQEVPHSVAVEIIDFNERQEQELIDIRANIYVERKSQKGILIGKNGSMLKKIGSAAREDIESLLNTKVFLDLWVKVKKDWREKEDALKMLGYRG
ncbi:GTP-binding protein Era [Halobacteroides halobius DSM 5150]|uniref:GTPase Era n=1 Tax=Halobacteroides halobius (strain ATCC 35273 / DSM 5150 / MD-1) TaxID=748449 RepID=L0K952_HALHC|nr:GTPase Era [Halobacteroides halobius]AGB41792.1 GTP-binding protein Era [Halobacteroides halobius DSM 5150]